MREKLNKIPTYKRKLFLLALAAVGSVAIGATAAAIVHNMRLDNRLKTPTVEAYVKEEFGDKGVKEVSFTNHGEANAFIRVSWAESWNYKPEKGYPEVLSNYAVLQSDEGQPITTEIAKPNWLGVEHKSEADDTSEMLWQDGGDGWWYYKKILPPGETTDLIINKVDFANVEKLSEEDKAKYKKATYDLHFTVEAVQASEERRVSSDAVRALFGTGVNIIETGTDEGWKQAWANKAEELITWEFPSNSNGTRLAEEAETGGEGN